MNLCIRISLLLSCILILNNCQQASNEAQPENSATPEARLNKRITVVYDTSAARYILYGEEQVGTNWTTSFDTITCTVGYNGIAAPGEKREGDGMTPSGEFALGAVFAYDNDLGLKDNFIELEPYHYWVSESNAETYNTLVDYDPAPLEAEKMERGDILYKYGIIINYNTDPVVPGKGSAIFLHIYRSPEKPTAGCVAISEEDIVQLIRWTQDVTEARIRIIS